ncbi:universal stress protein, partial [Rhizobium ruizarguesonis]
MNAELLRMEIVDCNRGGLREMEQDMTAQYFRPLATYPDSSSGLIISNAGALAGYDGA